MNNIGQFLDFFVQVGLAHPLNRDECAKAERKEDQEILQEILHYPRVKS